MLYVVLGRGHTILTPRELMWCYASIWDVRGELTLNSMAEIHTCHSAYVTRSHVERWSAHVPARLSYFCCRTHFMRREVTWPSRERASDYALIRNRTPNRTPQLVWMLWRRGTTWLRRKSKHQTPIFQQVYWLTYLGMYFTLHFVFGFLF
jgi:hypothetical protein